MLYDIISTANIECIICTPTKVKNVTLQTSTCTMLKMIIVMGATVSDENKQLAEEAKLEIYSFKEVEVSLEDNLITTYHTMLC